LAAVLTGSSYETISIPHGGRWGYIDTSGRYVVEPQYSSADSFNNGLAKVKTLEGKEAYIDTAGKVVWSQP
jgi:hypothetical protein